MVIGEIAFKDAKRIVQAGFPGAKSRRTVKVEVSETFHVSDYWDGGSRNEARFVDLERVRLFDRSQVDADEIQKFANPLNLPIYNVRLKPEYCIVEHVIFCGKDLGYRVHLHPSLKDSWQQVVSK